MAGVEVVKTTEEEQEEEYGIDIVELSSQDKTLISATA